MISFFTNIYYAADVALNFCRVLVVRFLIWYGKPTIVVCFLLARFVWGCAHTGDTKRTATREKDKHRPREDCDAERCFSNRVQSTELPDDSS